MFKKGKYWSNLMAELFLSRDPRFIPSIEKKKTQIKSQQKKCPRGRYTQSTQNRSLPFASSSLNNPSHKRKRLTKLELPSENKV